MTMNFYGSQYANYQNQAYMNWRQATANPSLSPIAGQQPTNNFTMIGRIHGLHSGCSSCGK